MVEASNVVEFRKPEYDHIDMVRQFEEAEEATEDNRKLQERDIDYRDNKQLTSTEKKELEKRGQPAVVFNEIRPKVNTMLGLEKQTRKDPKAFPRNPGDEKAAEAATDGVRYICEDSNWDDKRSRCADDLIGAGVCAAKVGFKQHRNALDPAITRIAWDRFYYDPASSEYDFADARFLGEVIWMDLDDALRKFPDAEEALETTWRGARDDSTFSDKPKYGMWADYKRKRVRLCEHYYNDGGWKFCIFTRGGFVVEPMDSPYLDDEEQPECPIKAVSLYVDRDNNRFGEVRAMIDPQDEVNKRRSKALHLISQRQLRVSPAVAMDPKDILKEMVKPDGLFIGDQGDVEVLPTNDMALGNLNLLQDAREHIHRTGANSALAGKDTQSQSGRAIIAQQQGGITESAGFLDAIRILSISVYRSVWGRIKQAWNEERWVRVTDNENNIRFVGFNRPITALEMAGQRLGITEEMLQSGQADPQAMAMLQAFAQDPRAQQVVGTENNPHELDVDIILDEGIDTPTIAAEQFSELVQLASSGIPIPPDVLIEASSLRNKDRLLEMMKQGPSPEQQAAAELELASKQAEVENTQSDTAKNYADIQIDSFKAGAGA